MIFPGFATGLSSDIGELELSAEVALICLIRAFTLSDA